jgi:hypothetical protein
MNALYLRRKQMRRFRVVAALTVLALLFSLNGIAAAQEPNTVSNFSISPSSASIGTSVEFQGDYTVTNPGTDQVAICFYFATADASSWNTNFTGLGSVAGVNFTKYSDSNPCPSASGYGNIGFYATSTGNAAFGDTFEQDVDVPSIATGSKIVAVRQYEGSDCSLSGLGTGTCTLVNYDSTNFTVESAPNTVYAASSTSACSGYDPCYTSLSSAYSAVAAGGTLYVVDDMPAESLTINKNLTLASASPGSITGDGSSNAVSVGNGTVNIIDLAITQGGAGNTVNVVGGTVTIKGCSIDGGGTTAIFQGAGTVTAYANNVTNYGSQAINGTVSAPHNWWGTYTSQPTGVTSADWGKRLGAEIESWGEDTLGDASISGGTGTGVVISHGRGSGNAPFDQATTEDGNSQCSDYYDFFVAPGGSGTWDVTVPIDDIGGCDAVYNNRALFLFDASGTCMTSGSPDVDCWDHLVDNLGYTVAQLGNRKLRWSGASTANLGGTPLASGNQDLNDPTAINMVSVSASSNIWLAVGLVVGVSVLALGALVVLRKRA